MKNKYLAFFILTLMIFVIYVYIYPPVDMGIVKKEEDKNILVGNETDSETKDICFNNYGLNPSTLEIELINSMVKGYMNNQLTTINGSDNRIRDIGSQDARAIWFDYKSLKAFLDHIGYLAKQNNKNVNIDSLGVRIYYASYPFDKEWIKYDDLNYSPMINKASKYQYKHTLIFVPTIRDEGIDHDYDPRKNLKLLELDNIGGMSAVAFTLGDRTNAKNTGSLWPPDNLVDNEYSRRINGIKFPFPELTNQ